MDLRVWPLDQQPQHNPSLLETQMLSPIPDLLRQNYVATGATVF